MYNQKISLFAAIFFVMVSSAYGIDTFPDPNSYPDFNSDEVVNFTDFAMFALNWQESGVGLDGDFDDNGIVDENDLETFSFLWMSGPHPLEVFEEFKAALSVADVNDALTFIAEASKERYAEVFQIMEPNLPNYVAGMGEMIYDRQIGDQVKYEMVHQDGEDTLLFPVIFVREDDGKWRIFNI
jgi:hypothetical protein